MILSSATIGGESEIVDAPYDASAALRRRVLRAARHLIAQRGLGVSMDEIAEAAGLGRRTLFRHFENRDELVAAALASALDWYGAQLDRVTTSDQPLDEWLRDLVARVHEIHGHAGRGLWEIAASDEGQLSAQLAVVNQRRRNERRNVTQAIARAAWRRAGGTGRCPEIIADACALTISSFVTHSMMNDYEREPQAVVRCTVALLSALLRTEVDRTISSRTTSTRTNTRPVIRTKARRG